MGDIEHILCKRGKLNHEAGGRAGLCRAGEDFPATEGFFLENQHFITWEGKEGIVFLLIAYNKVTFILGIKTKTKEKRK